MREWFMTAMLVIAALSTAVGPAAAERRWVLQTGAGLPRESLKFDLDGPHSVTLGLASPLQPWFQAGVEASYHDLRQRNYHGVAWPSANPVKAERAYAVLLAATFRLQWVVPSGPAPFVSVESGIGRMRWLEVPVYGQRFIMDREEFIATSALGVGIRAVVPGAWPDVEGSMRFVMWASEDITFLEPRLTLAF